MDDNYEEQVFTRNNHSVNNSRMEINRIEPEDELVELYDIRDKIENDIRGLWQSIIKRA